MLSLSVPLSVSSVRHREPAPVPLTCSFSGRRRRRAASPTSCGALPPASTPTAVAAAEERIRAGTARRLTAPSLTSSCATAVAAWSSIARTLTRLPSPATASGTRGLGRLAASLAPGRRPEGHSGAGGRREGRGAPYAGSGVAGAPETGSGGIRCNRGLTHAVTQGYTGTVGTRCNMVT